jgi:hypothetical protein
MQSNKKLYSLGSVKCGDNLFSVFRQSGRAKQSTQINTAQTPTNNLLNSIIRIITSMKNNIPDQLR